MAKEREAQEHQRKLLELQRELEEQQRQKELAAKQEAERLESLRKQKSLEEAQ